MDEAYIKNSKIFIRIKTFFVLLMHDTQLGII